jgi:hypothetical protein
MNLSYLFIISGLLVMLLSRKRQDISSNLQELFSDRRPISIFDAYDMTQYIITPYKDVKILTTKQQLTTWAQYNTTLFKHGMTVMVFTSTWPNNMKTNNKCYLAGLSNTFYMNIMCNPFDSNRGAYYPVDIVDDCTYSLDYYTVVACPYGWHTEL